MDRYTLASEIRRLLPEAIGPVRDHLQQAHDLCLRTAENGVTDKQLAALPKGTQLSDPSCQGLVARPAAA